MELNIASIVSTYGLELIESSKVRSIYKCETNKGTKSLKEVQTSKDKIVFEYYIKEHLYNNGFRNVNRFDVNEETNLPYVEIGDKCFVLSDWIEGRECDLEKEEEMKLAITTLAKLHIASRGFEIQEDINVKTDIGRLEEFYVKRLNELIRYKRKLKKEIVLEDFDKLYLQSVDLFIEDANLSLEILKKSKYKDIVELTMSEKSFCHHDYAFHNIIINDKKELYVIDFEYANYEIKMYDLANVVKRRMRKCNWNIDETKKMIEIYDEVLKISYDELEVLYAMLIFPQKFWRIINRHYNGKKIWKMENDVIKLQGEIDEEKFHKEFIKNYNKEILN